MTLVYLLIGHHPGLSFPGKDRELWSSLTVVQYYKIMNIIITAQQFSPEILRFQRIYEVHSAQVVNTLQVSGSFWIWTTFKKAFSKVIQAVTLPETRGYPVSQAACRLFKELCGCIAHESSHMMVWVFQRSHCLWVMLLKVASITHRLTKLVVFCCLFLLSGEYTFIHISQGKVTQQSQLPNFSYFFQSWRSNTVSWAY